MAAAVVVLPSGVPIAGHHVLMLLALHAMWNRSQYASVFDLSLLLVVPSLWCCVVVQ